MTTVTQLESKINFLTQEVNTLKTQVNKRTPSCYTPTKSEMNAIYRGIQQADAGQFASQKSVDALWAKYE